MFKDIHFNLQFILSLKTRVVFFLFFYACQTKGDVIVSINGQDVERADHATLVSIIQSCPDRIRMVVVYENWSV